jgi:hypothetical protein
MSNSEVAQLLREIETTYEAAQRGLSAYATVSRHEFITAQLERIRGYQVSLEQLVGEREALELLATTLGAK